jgi:hypothetical protein
MSNFPNCESIVQGVLQGIESAKKNYFFWTNNRLFLSYGPQKIITIHVAQALGALPEAPEVFIDATVADILRCSLPKRNGYSEYMHSVGLTQGTVNITLDERFEHASDNDSVSKAIISVKNGVRNPKEDYINEIDRLCKMLVPNSPSDSTLECAMFAFYSDLSEGARVKLAKRIPNIIANFDKVVAKYPKLQSGFETLGIEKIPEVGEWCAGCYFIIPKN